MFNCPTTSRIWVKQFIFRCWGSELSVDDLRTGRGVVLGRAVATLRSVETQPLVWGFVLLFRRELHHILIHYTHYTIYSCCVFLY